MTLWRDLPFLGFDLETTGLDLPGARIVTAALVAVDPANPSDTRKAAYLTDPGIPIPEQASSIHGITTEMARRDGESYLPVYERVRDTLTDAWAEGRAVVAYNAAYDLSVIHHEGLRLGYPPLRPGTVIDPLVIDRQLTRRAGSDRSRKLNPTAQEHRVRHDVEHDAIEDVLATLRIVWRLRNHPTIARWTAEKLQRFQQLWYEQHAVRLRDYYREHPEKGRDPNAVTSDWPVRYGSTTHPNPVGTQQLVDASTFQF